MLDLTTENHGMITTDCFEKEGGHTYLIYLGLLSTFYRSVSGPKYIILGLALEICQPEMLSS